MATLILALCNQKGGVGKSTTTFHLARAAIVAGRRVLAVDNDPHGNLTNPPGEERRACQNDLAITFARPGVRLDFGGPP